jgi:hypothetical protein
VELTVTDPSENPEADLPLTQQPDPMLHERRAGPLAFTLTSVAMAVIVMVVLYGMTREPAQDRAASATASAPVSATTGQGAGGAPAQSQQGTPDAKARNPQERARQGTPEQNRGQQSQTQGSPPFAGDAAAGTVGGPSARPAPQAREKPPERAPADRNAR